MKCGSEPYLMDKQINCIVDMNRVAEIGQEGS